MVQLYRPVTGVTVEVLLLLRKRNTISYLVVLLELVCGEGSRDEGFET